MSTTPDEIDTVRKLRDTRRRYAAACREISRLNGKILDLEKKLEGAVHLGMRAIEKWIAFKDRTEPGWEKP